MAFSQQLTKLYKTHDCLTANGARITHTLNYFGLPLPNTGTKLSQASNSLHFDAARVEKRSENLLLEIVTYYCNIVADAFYTLFRNIGF